MYLFLSSTSGFLQCQIDVVAKIHTSRGIGSRPHTPAKQISKNPGQIAETPTEEISKLEISHEVVRRPPFAHAGVAGCIVFFSFYIVGEDGVGFREFSELRRRVRISTLIRMVLQRQLSVGMLNLIAGGGSIDSEDFIIVSLGVGTWHRRLPLSSQMTNPAMAIDGFSQASDAL
jgi:hypothetical protein